MTVSEILSQGSEILSDAGIEDAEFEARFLTAAVLGIKTGDLLLHRDESLQKTDLRRIERAFNRRAKNEPTAYILRRAGFYRDEFIVSRRSLIPRPDTEHLLYEAEELGIQPKNILDIGTGTGAIAVSLHRLFPNAKITALDVDTRTVKKNLKNLLLSEKITVVRKSIFRYRPSEKFDLIVSNPPYLNDEEMSRLPKSVADFEPHLALYGGKNGMNFYREIARFSERFGSRKTCVILEIDSKYEEVRKIFEQVGFKFKNLRKDYGSLPRVLSFEK